MSNRSFPPLADSYQAKPRARTLQQDPYVRECAPIMHVDKGPLVFRLLGYAIISAWVYIVIAAALRALL